ncbi:MAG: YjfI family protein [Psychromonas sp.]|nr:YjfI family protein [Psychromonas sp.]
MNIHKIATHLNQLDDKTETGFYFDCTPINGDIDVLQVEIIGREEIPIFISISDNQILCIAYLWGEDEIKTGLKANMMEAMLEMNIPMPLSSFAKIEDKFVVFGALSVNSSLDDIELEIVTLSDNSLEVIKEMDSYLN